MKKKPKNKKITTNFSLYEFVEGKAMPKQAIEMNWENIELLSEEEMFKTLTMLEKDREEINKEFKKENDNKNITIIITSGWRCPLWEKSKGRGELTRHSRAFAVDWIPGNCSDELAVKIMEWHYKKYSGRNTGWKGGYAIKKATIKNGKILAKGFIHKDRMPEVTRWFY